MRLWWLTMAALPVIGSLPANGFPSRGEFIYSSLCWGKESGDASGYRVRLVRTDQGDQLYLEWSEGPLVGPRLAVDLKIDPKTSDISFAIPLNFPPPEDNFDRYTGHISIRNIVLNGRKVPRAKTATAKLGVCRP